MDRSERPRPFRSLPIRRVVIIAAVALGLAASAGGYVLLQYRRTSRPLIVSGQGRAARQNASLRAYAARGELGSLVPQTDAILGIREEFLQKLIDRSLPFRQYFQDGQYVARLDSATVRLESGLALITLAGRGMIADQEGSPLYVDLLLQGLMNITGVDPNSGALQAGLVITDVSARRAGPEDLQSLLNPVAGYFGRLKAEDWNRNSQSVNLPLRIEREFVLPAIDGDVTVPESRIPISVRVSAVTTLSQRMAVSLALAPDSMSGETEHPADERWNSQAPLRPRPALRIPRWGRTSTQPDSLRVQVARLAQRDLLWRAVAETDHDVVMVVPATVVRTVTRRVTRRYLKGVVVDVRPEATLRLDNELKVKVLGGKMGVGRFKGTIHISHLKGALSVAGDPRVTFDPPHEVAITAPIRLLAGRGSVNMDIEWKPAFLVSAVCSGFRFQETLEGEILPLADELTTRIRFEVRDSSIVGWPRVQRDTIRFGADLTDGSWGKVREELVQQDRFGRCGMMMNPDSTLTKLRTLAGLGIKVRLPPRVFKPFLMPVMLEGFYMAGPYRIEARAFDPAIEVRPEYLRLAFRANLRVSSQPDTTRRTPPTGVPTPQSGAQNPQVPASK